MTTIVLNMLADALSAMSGVDFVAICGGGGGTRSGCGADRVDFGAQPDGH